MCKMLYIGADHPLPTTAPWDEKTRSFHVVAAREEDEPSVRAHLQTRHAVYAGSHQGCGCGFYHSPEEQLEEELAIDGMPDCVKRGARESWEQGRRCVLHLRYYLEAATAAGPVRVLVTWAGEETTPPQRVLTVTPDYFGGNGFRVEELTLLEVQSRPPV